MKIHAPAGSDYTASTWFGHHQLDFVNGVAEFDGDLPDGIRIYLEQHGYGIGSEAKAPEPAAAPVDSRDLADQQVGGPLRDAAVDPSDGDFLPPVGAGDGDPHGPDVVAPGIHGLETKAVLPGDVSDLDRQQARESELAARTLAGDEPVPHVVGELADGAIDRKVDAADPQTDAGGAEKPAGNATTAEWRAYAVTRGLSEDEAEKLGRDELRERFAD